MAQRGVNREIKQMKTKEKPTTKSIHVSLDLHSKLKMEALNNKLTLQELVDIKLSKSLK